MIYYVYAYINKKTGLPYYIGKGKGNRAFANHGRVKTPKDKTKIIFLETFVSNFCACALEIYYIKKYGRKDLGTGILLNQTDGGEGRENVIVSEETRKKLSSSGKKSYDEGKRTISGCFNPEFHVGRKRTNETRKKQSNKRKNKIWEEIYNEETLKIMQNGAKERGKNFGKTNIGFVSAIDIQGNCVKITKQVFDENRNIFVGVASKEGIKRKQMKKGE